MLKIWLSENFVLFLASAFLAATALSILGVFGAWKTGRRLGRPPRPLARFALSILAVAAGLGGVALLGQGLLKVVPVAREHGRMLGKPAPELAFRYVEDGLPGELGDYRGQVVLLNVWATWCPPCREEMPALDRLQDTYGPQGLVVLQVSDEPREVLASYLESEPMSTRHAFVQPIPWPEFGRPTTFVIDRDGVVRKIFSGSREYAGFEREISNYL